MSKRENSIIKSRLIFFIVGLTGFFGLLFFRLVDLQVIHGESYARLADDNRFFSMSIPAERGVLLDRYHDPLVHNTRSYFSLEKGNDLFSERRSISREEALQKMATESGTVEQRKSVGYDLIRLYKYPKSLAHILGYVGPVTAEDLENDRQLKISDNVGKMGLERNYDSLLQGQEGKDIFEIDALGSKQQIKQRKEAIPGANIQTALDPYLSEVALNALGNNQGTVIIADAESGEVLTLVNSPGFDANAFSKIEFDTAAEQSRKNMVKSFLSDQRQVFFNKAVGGSYPPGSIFKLVTAMAGLESGSIDLGTTVIDEGILKVGEYKYANWYYTQYGRTEGEIGLVRSIARSNDIFFYKAAEFTGPNDIAKTARMFGLGQTTGIEIESQASGLVPDPEWKEKTKGERWFLGNTYHYGIGQGDILVSPIQMIQMVQAIANNGKMCNPSLLSNTNDVQDCTELGFNQENIDIVLEGMLDACSSGGTGFPFFEHNGIYRTKRVLVNNDGDSDDGVEKEIKETYVASNPNDEIENGAIACKTGTAEFGGADEQGYRKTHAWFVGVVGVNKDSFKDDDVFEEDVAAEYFLENNFGRSNWLEKVNEHGFPDKLIFVTLVESDEENPFKEGSKDAGPVVKEVVDWMLGE